MSQSPKTIPQPLILTVPIEDTTKSAALFGPTDVHLRAIRASFAISVAARDGAIRLSGESSAVKRAAAAINFLQEQLRTHDSLTPEAIEDAIEMASLADSGGRTTPLEVYADGTRIIPRTEGQREYVQAILDNDLTFCLGPAGTGKTYLAVAVAVTLLKQKRIDRLVLARPAVEAGEKLGYLPGDIKAKVNPYLRPLFDALNDMMGAEQIRRFMDNDVIEVSPLAFMRGRTLSKSVIILDEAQNTTVAQMQMFLTRLGQSSKMVVTGDDSQTDLAPGHRSGVLDAVQRLSRVRDIAILRLTASDIVRHPLVSRIVDAYESDQPREG